MYDDILLPSDGSAAVEVMIRHGLALAECFDARLHALHVVDETESGPAIVGSKGDERSRSASRDEAHAAVDRIATAAADRDVAATTEIREGQPHREILHYAEEADIDVIVMSTHGRSGLSRFLIGSVTERVIRLSDRPVLAVGRDGDD